MFGRNVWAVLVLGQSWDSVGQQSHGTVNGQVAASNIHSLIDVTPTAVLTTAGLLTSHLTSAPPAVCTCADQQTVAK